MFQDRTDAGRQLARALQHYRSAQPLVMGLPRGGVVVGAEIARGLNGTFDALLVKKLRAPGNPELAVGALSEDGAVYVNPEIISLLGADSEYLDREIAERRAELTDQRKLYRATKARVSPTGH